MSKAICHGQVQTLPVGRVLNFAAIREKRIALGLSMVDAAARSGLGRKQAWYAIETGRNKNITLDTLDAIATVLECEPAALLSPATRSKPKP